MQDIFVDFDEYVNECGRGSSSSRPSSQQIKDMKSMLRHEVIADLFLPKVAEGLARAAIAAGVLRRGDKGVFFGSSVGGGALGFKNAGLEISLQHDISWGRLCLGERQCLGGTALVGDVTNRNDMKKVFQKISSFKGGRYAAVISMSCKDLSRGGKPQTSHGNTTYTRGQSSQPFMPLKERPTAGHTLLILRWLFDPRFGPRWPSYVCVENVRGLDAYQDEFKCLFRDAGYDVLIIKDLPAYLFADPCLKGRYILQAHPSHHETPNFLVVPSLPFPKPPTITPSVAAAAAPRRRAARGG